ncbi:MAG: HEAT repeat domain-containing protein [Pedosphaera sp.]|nr:HEAT repeat domain-containing protein [Pedosphaera sp.]
MSGEDVGLGRDDEVLEFVPRLHEAEFAIQQIGTNAIPFLLDRVRERDSVVKKKLRAILPRKWQDKLRLGDNSGEVRRTGAHGLAALGTNAPAAVPALIEIASHHPDEDGRYIAVFALRTLGTASEPAIPFLIQCLTNKVDIIRDDAAMGLGGIGRQPEISVPALIQYLEFARTSPHSFELSDAIGALSKFGPAAKAAVPILLSLLNHPNPNVRDYLTNYLPIIDAEAAAKAGVKRQQ